MKKYIILIILILCYVAAAAREPQTRDKTRPSVRRRWFKVGTVTVGTVSPGVSQRDYATMAARSDTSIEHWKVPYDAGMLELRFWTTANDGSSEVVELWAARGKYYDDGVWPDHFTLAGILTMTCGTQVASTSARFFDTIVESSPSWVASSTIIDSGNNRICRYYLDPAGYTDWVFLPTTHSPSTTLYIDGCEI